MKEALMLPSGAAIERVSKAWSTSYVDADGSSLSRLGNEAAPTNAAHEARKGRILMIVERVPGVEGWRSRARQSKTERKRRELMNQASFYSLVYAESGTV